MTKIEWTEETWNVISGCTQLSEGCQNCYAKRLHKRLAAMGQSKYSKPFNTIVFHPEELKRKHKTGSMIFVNSMSDTFHQDITDEEIEAILKHCEENKNNKFQLLTKRADRVPNFTYPNNVWLGVTVESKNHKDRIEFLKKTNAKIKFLSCEPLLSDLGELNLNGIDWVIVGGESGFNARPMKAEWVRNIQKQCEQQKVAFFFKQWGEWANTSQVDYATIKTNFKTALISNSEVVLNTQIDEKTGTYRFGRKYTGSMLDGKYYKEYPKGV